MRTIGNFESRPGARISGWSTPGRSKKAYKINLRMRHFRRFVALFLAVWFLLEPVASYWGKSAAYAQPTNPPRTSVSLKPLVDDLMPKTTDMTDTDNDCLPDSVEAVIGTDPNEADSDQDGLKDNEEVEYDLDPLEPDSNFDGLPDYLEVAGVAADFDGDGLNNGWDFDNDGDGVNDGVDLCPFSQSGVQTQIHFDITTKDQKPLYITFQLRPKQPKHLRLFGQHWDWPDNDTEGTMQDRDGSKEDVTVFPFLNLTLNVPP